MFDLGGPLAVPGAAARPAALLLDWLVWPGQLLQVVLLLPLHAPVLEPDLDLALREPQHVRYLDAATPGQVAVEVEFFL